MPRTPKRQPRELDKMAVRVLTSRPQVELTVPQRLLARGRKHQRRGGLILRQLDRLHPLSGRPALSIPVIREAGKERQAATRALAPAEVIPQREATRHLLR